MSSLGNLENKVESNADQAIEYMQVPLIYALDTEGFRNYNNPKFQNDKEKEIDWNKPVVAVLLPSSDIATTQYNNKIYGERLIKFLDSDKEAKESIICAANTAELGTAAKKHQAAQNVYALLVFPVDKLPSWGAAASSTYWSPPSNPLELLKEQAQFRFYLPIEDRGFNVGIKPPAPGTKCTIM